ncbi:hypothetical protein PF011_g17501 [Phytophthora fragariae]|uniref:Ankyrin repeat protein n=1 Tax=Phytophthora fragariae TaxID=53985 RepID=A0A6A3JGD7_9STRA|nr:hypothetical protein PF011_g17501 [Phytophthora fragariae]
MKLLSTAPIRRAVSEGDLNMVKWFHQNYFELCERDLLQLAVQNGHMDVTRWLFEHGYEINTSELVVAAAESNNVTLVRWLIENGRTLDASTAAMLAKNDDYVEAMWWVPEPERVQLVLEAMHDENRKLLWWLLMRTRFEEKISYIAISGAIDEAAASMREWLLDNIDDDEVCRWCFSESERCQVVKLRRRNPYHLPNGLAAIRFLCSYILVMHSTNSTIAHLINTLL